MDVKSILIIGFTVVVIAIEAVCFAMGYLRNDIQSELREIKELLKEKENKRR